MERIGNAIKAYLHNTLVASATDASFKNGKVGVGTHNDGAAFDSLHVTLASASYRLSWAAPTLTSPTTIKVINADRSITLDKTRDYVIDIAAGRERPGGYVHGPPEEAACYTCPGVYHPDIIQNWGGPTYYRIDRLTGSSNYQGFMMQPTQYGNPTLLADSAT